MKKAKQNPMDCGARSERRTSTRYQIRGVAWFEWEGEDGQCRQGMGITRDVSKAGTFIETPAGPAVGALVKVAVTISGGAKDEMQVRLCGAGDVRHVQNDGAAGSGFGGWVGFHTEGVSAK